MAAAWPLSISAMTIELDMPISASSTMPAMVRPARSSSDFSKMGCMAEVCTVRRPRQRCYHQRAAHAATVSKPETTIAKIACRDNRLASIFRCTSLMVAAVFPAHSAIPRLMYIKPASPMHAVACAHVHQEVSKKWQWLRRLTSAGRFVDPRAVGHVDRQVRRAHRVLRADAVHRHPDFHDFPRHRVLAIPGD